MQAIGGILIALIYLILAGLLVLLLINAIKKRDPRRWLILIAFQLFFALIAFIIGMFLENLTKPGIITGKTYLPEIIICYTAAIIYLISALPATIYLLLLARSLRSPR